MKNKVIILLLLFSCIIMTGCSNKLSEDEIKNMLEINTSKRTFKVNEVVYASEKTIINEINMQVKDNNVTLGNYEYKSEEENYKQITGYYEQSSATYNIYMLSENEDGETTIWKMSKNDIDQFNSAEWEKEIIEGATDLILINCTETDEQIGQTPLRYQVYALVDNELVIIN